MSQLGVIETNNNEIERLLKSDSQESDRIKPLIKKNKIIVYSVDELSK